MSPIIGIIAAVVAASTALVLQLSSNWRMNIGILAAQYVVTFYMIALEWPFIFALVVLTSGWISAAILGMALISQEGKAPAHNRTIASTKPLPSFLIISISVIIILVMGSISPLITIWIPNLEGYQSWSALLFLSMGLVRQVIKRSPVDVIITNLMILSGFEVLFSGLMLNPVVIALLVSITLFLALSGAFLIYDSQLEKTS